MAFNHQLVCPSAFDELDIDESEFEAIAKRTQAGAEWQFRAPDITEESFIQCMRQQNQAGRLSSLPCSAAVNPLAPSHKPIHAAAF